MKNIISTLSFFLVFSSIFAQFEDPELVGNNNSYGINNVVTPDIDQDGDLDIVFYSSSTDRICWSENTFPEDYLLPSKVLMDSIYSVSFFTSGDIDNDGDIDFAYARADFNSIYWIENQGNMNFSNPHRISDSLMDVRNIVLTDIDGDNDLDIVSASYDDNKVAWFEKLDGGNFGTEQIISLDLDGTRNVAVNDLDNDGDIDIVACSKDDNKIVWYENLDGSGDFSLGNVIAILDDVRKIVIKDVDQDGYNDIVAGSYLGDKFVWYQNLGGFGIFSQENFITNFDGFSSFDATDMDADGDLDFVISSYNTGTDQELTWYENDGGIFSNPNIIYSKKTVAFSFADLNNDNQLDFVLSPTSGLVYLKNINNSESFQGRTLEIPYESYCDLVVGDVDNDGLGDIITVSSNVILYKTISEEPYQFQTRTPITILGNTTVFHKVDLKDLDNDNDLDLIYCSQYGLSWRENDGAGNFSGGASINSGDYNDFEIADMDNDGDLDIVSTGESLGINWWENDNGTFTNKTEIYDWSFSDYIDANLELADLDNDGDIDVVSAFQTSPTGVYWFENTTGAGNFSAPEILSSTIDCQNAKIADVNGDALLDIMVNESGGSFYWFQGSGDGNFNPPIEVPFIIPGLTFEGSSFGFDAGDIDLDGDLDILGTDLSSGNVFWIDNSDGHGDFNEVKIIKQISGFPYTSKLYDIHQDGDLDVFTGTWQNLTEINYFENTSFFVSTNEVEKEYNLISIFPNPAHDNFSIQPTLSKTTEVTYRLFNHQGLLVSENRTTVFPENSIEVNTKDFAAGLYIVELEYDGIFISKKIIIQK